MGMTRSGGSTINFATTSTLGGLSIGRTRIEFSGLLNSPDHGTARHIPSLSNGILPWAVI